MLKKLLQRTLKQHMKKDKGQTEKIHFTSH